MLNSSHPFNTEQLEHHVRSLFSPSSLMIGLLTAVTNHIVGAPPLWKALCFLSVGLMVLDIITGSLRATYHRKRRVCDKTPDVAEQCSMNAKEGNCTFNSRDLGATFIKAIVYGSFFVIATLVDLAAKMVLGGSTGYAIATLSLGAIAGREMLSNVENLKILCERIGVPWPFGKVEERLEDTLEALTGAADKDKDVEDTESPTKNTPD